MSFKIKIFYIWQSHTNEEYNKKLISSAINKAIKNLNGKGIFKNVKFDLDHDTKGIPGSPNINVSIETKIPKSDIYICDLTNINGDANGNVLYEFGQAADAHGLTSVIGVCNDFYGEPQSYLGFDINHNRFPITYTCHQDDDIEKATTSLSQSIEQAIRDIAVTVLENQDWKYRPFFTLTTLKRNFNELSGIFFSSEKINNINQAIKDNANQYSKIRLIGLSGLGKTRIMLNALDTDEIRWNVRYCDCGKEDSSAIKGAVEKMCREQDIFYLVLDNCTQDFANEINYILKKNGIQMPVLSIFNDRAEKTDSEYNILYLDTTDTEDIVKSIINNDPTFVLTDNKIPFK